MQGSYIDEQREGLARKQPGGDHPALALGRDEGRRGHVERSQDDVGGASELEALRAQVRRLEAELERYRTHAERTSRLFLAVTDYATWVREQARHDAQLALRKARARAEKLMATARELERTERELARRQTELERLEALTDETRTRLSAFLTTGLEVLEAEVEAGRNDPGFGQGDLRKTLHKQLSGASEQQPARLSAIEAPEA